VNPAAGKPDEVQRLLDEIASLYGSGNMSRRAALCETALGLVSRESRPQQWAYLQNQLADSLYQDPHGNRAESLERAISLYLASLEVYTRKAFPRDWAVTQNNLAVVYSMRILGSRADNLENSISSYRQASRLFTQKSFPAQWASIQSNLGMAYSERLHGTPADNMEKSISHYRKALEVYTQADFRQQRATTLSNLANSYKDRIHGVRADNLEKSIQYHKQALRVHTLAASPGEWVRITANLGLAYQNRIRGSRAANLEKSISCYRQALTVWTRAAYPRQWALTQGNMANSYSQRIRGTRAENLEQAIAHYEQALEVYTRKDLPEDWARTQTNLASAYGIRPRGVCADNQERAIAGFSAALMVYTRRAFPHEWAATQHSLANAYQSRIHGERADNLEQAIARYRQALTVRTRAADPQEWAATQNNLASAYTRRIRGDRAANKEQAIARYEEALLVRNRRASPQDWAATQGNLAMAYSERIRGDRAANLEQAIAGFRKVLRVNRQHAFPAGWASTQASLGSAYLERVEGHPAANRERAIARYLDALNVYTPEAFPQDWARTQANLALAYERRIHGRRADNVGQATAAYQLALSVYTPQAFPQGCRDSAYRLGRLLYDESRLAEARVALETAHHAVEALRGEARREAAKRSLAEDNADLYARLVSCCIAAGDVPAAFRSAAAGKGRAFVDLLAAARFDLPGQAVRDPALARDLARARETRQQTDNLLAAVTGESGTGSATMPRERLLAQLRAMQEQDRRHWEDMAYKYPALTATQMAPVLSADQARALSRQLGATLVEYYRHAGGWCAFVVNPAAVELVPLPLVTDQMLRRMAVWTIRLDHVEGRGPITLGRLHEWHDAVLAPLDGKLARDRPVVLAPFGILHVLPMAAALDRASQRYAAEIYQIGFAASLSVLNVAQQQARRAGTDRPGTPQQLLNVAYPGTAGSRHYLPAVMTEAESIAARFDQRTCLYRQDATPDAVIQHGRDQDVVHFGCHGWFDPRLPEQSGLLLAGGWLTVQRILTELRLTRVRVATLGACLSAREVVARGDEHLGLTQAMLACGVQSVVASLWRVDDDATRALFEAFYAHLVAGDPPAVALQAAGQRVRSDPEHSAWQHPYYWAAFQVSGLAHNAAAASRP
jgi:CHAT domain-containing protein/tetratricopeptide (TPR) repeat protein